MKIDFLKKELWDLLRTIQDSKDIVICPIAKTHNMTPLQLRLLMEINAAEEISLSRLAKVLEMNNGNVSTLCKKMEQRGLLTRERRLDDERYIALKISPDGKKILQQMDADMQDKYCLFLDCVSEEQLEKITTGLKELQLLLRKMNDQQRKD